VSTKFSEQLLLLSQTDFKIHAINTKKSDLEFQNKLLAEELSERRKRLSDLESAHKEGTLKQVLEEHRLRDEQHKITERRKQLGSIMGAKGAKLIEREIDISSRAVKLVEERAMRALEAVDDIQKDLQELKSSVEAMEEEVEKKTSENQEVISTLTDELKGLEKERDGLLKKLEDKVRNLYRRVQGRYPGQAVAEVKNQSCRSCFRALPPQTYNQILAGSALVQCPGCNRILAYLGNDAAK